MKKILLSKFVTVCTLFGLLSVPAALSMPAAAAKAGRSSVVSRQTRLYPVSTGMWGGRDLGFEVLTNSVKIEFDCAEGQIPRRLKADKKGNFKIVGTFTPHAMGPVRRDNPPKPVPALYEGKITGKTMTIKVSLLKTNESRGDFTIEHGEAPMLFRCQ